MDKKLFDKLAESMLQMGEIVRGERAPSVNAHVDANHVKEVSFAFESSQQPIRN